MAKEGAKQAITAPPAGTGYAPGLGEAFTINFSTGQGVYSYRLTLPQGVAGHTPGLALQYAHGNGHGTFGQGWQLPLRGIVRRLDFGVPDAGGAERFTDGGNEIVQLEDGNFAASSESGFARYHRRDGGWVIEERNGAVHELGLTGEARLSPPDRPDRPHTWLIERSLDPSNNAIIYKWRTDAGLAYLAEVRYSAFAVRFVHDERPDTRQDGRAGYQRERRLRCARIEVILDPDGAGRPVRSWLLDYDQAVGSGVSLLAGVRMVAHGPAPDGSQDVRRRPVTFGYSTAFGDDGKLLHSTGIMRGRSPGISPPPLSDPDAALVAVDSAPLPGILLSRNGRPYYWPNRGDGTFGEPRPIGSTPLASSFARAGLAFVDMDSSGTADLLATGTSAPAGYYENQGRQGFTRFVAFPRGHRAGPPFRSSAVRLSDCDGDGRIDALASRGRSFAVWLNQGESGWSDPLLAVKGEGAAAFDVDLGEPGVALADMTGDGLMDLVRVRSGRVEYWPNLGMGRFGPRIIMKDSPPLAGLLRDARRFVLADVDGDGCADLIVTTPDGIDVYLNRNGDAFTPAMPVRPVPPIVPGSLRAANMRGRAGTGLVWNTPSGRRTAFAELQFGGDQPAYLLRTVDNGSGLRSEIQYRSAVEDLNRDRDKGAEWETHFPFPYLVVAGTSEEDLVSGQKTETEYRYHEAHFSTARRQFQGFRRTDRIERGDASRPDTLTVLHFLMGQELQPGHGPQHAALNGMLARTEILGLDGTPQADSPYRVEESEYALTEIEDAASGRARTFVHVAVHRVIDLERGSDQRVEERRYGYDALGNTISEELRAHGVRDGVAQPERRRAVETSYVQSEERYRVDQPARIVTRDETGRILSEVRRRYDGEPFVGLPLGRAGRGLLTVEEHLVLSEADFSAHYAGLDADELGYVAGVSADDQPGVFAPVSRYAYDARGLRTGERDAVGNETTYEYDADGLFRTALTTATGTTRFDYDRALGAVTAVTYSNGKILRFLHDSQGRVLAAALPGESLDDPPARYSYDDSTIPHARIGRFRADAGAADESEAVTYFDGRGKEFQQRTKAGPGRFVVSGLRRVNARGELAEEFEPTFAADAAFALPEVAGRPSRRLEYDALGRVVRTLNYNGGIATAEYSPFVVITRDANDTDASPENIARGQFETPHLEEMDVLRNLVAVSEDLSGGRVRRLSYGTSSVGELLEIADDAGVLAEYVYDRRGMRLEIRHREAGLRRLWCDGRGLTVRTLDAEGNDLRARIDARGRLAQLTRDGAVLENYVYDDPARNALGRLAEVSYPGGQQTFDYDDAGRLITHKHFFTDMGPIPETLTYGYDRLGREIQCLHTDGTVVRRDLTANGWIRAIPGVVDEIDYDPRGLPILIRYANGIHSDVTYTAGPGRVRTQKTTAPGGQILENITYRHDLLEMLLESEDTSPQGAGTRRYAYDPLYQIIQTEASLGDGAATHTYEHSNFMNLTRFDEADCLMHYDDPAHPDRLAGITQGANPRFATPHDDNGNMLTLPGRRFGYNAKNELASVSRDDGLVADYRYDHEGRRIAKTITEPGGSVNRTYFVGDRADIQEGRRTVFVLLGSVRVAFIAGAKTTFVHPDPLGGTAFFSDAAAVRIAVVAYRPYGNMARSEGQIDRRTYGIHPFDAESGLFYMRKRYYAPEIGRFLSPDPLAIYQPTEYLHNPKALQVYAFVANDPLNRTDFTGLSFWSVVGAIVGVIAAVAVAALVVVTGGIAGVLLGIALAVGIVSVSYVVASASEGTGFGEFMRGFMIGFNAGLNAILASAVFGPGIGLALGVINFLAAFDTVANSAVYQGILGWSNWLMPMSWVATGIGLAFFVLNVIPAIFTLNQVNAVKIDSLSIDWGTGTIVTQGGWTFLPGFRGGFNLGNFTYITPGSGVLDHETGHTLSSAAFGSIFHFVGAIDENLVQSTKANAYAERIADSHDAGGPSSRAAAGEKPIIPMWV